MILKQGDVFEARYKVNVMCATTCAVRDKDGHLVMGKGNAGRFKLYWSYLPRVFGEMMPSTAYGLMIYHPQRSYSPNVMSMGAFQTKYHWRDKSDLDLIRLSTQYLFQWLLQHPDATVALPYPGINNGKLTRAEVYPVIKLLPDNVTVYDLGDR